MIVTKTIKLDADEVKAIETTLQIVDKISDACGKSMDRVFGYFFDNSDITETFRYKVDDLIEIDEI